MSEEFYKIIHLLGAFMVVAGFGAAVALSLAGASAKGSPGRSLAVVTHGIGLFLALLGGFGLQAKLHIGFPGWIYAKIALWLALGGLLTLALRKADLAKPIWFTVLALGAVAAYLGVVQPF